MTSDPESRASDAVLGLLRRQGITVPPERSGSVAAAVARLEQTARVLDAEIPFPADPQGFLAYLYQWIRCR